MERMISVFGPGHPSRKEYNQAADVGRLLAEAGCTVVCGGLFGVMEAACMGAKEAGGSTVGILRTYNRYDAKKRYQSAKQFARDIAQALEVLSSGSRLARSA